MLAESCLISFHCPKLFKTSSWMFFFSCRRLESNKDPETENKIFTKAIVLLLLLLLLVVLLLLLLLLLSLLTG